MFSSSKSKCIKLMKVGLFSLGIMCMALAVPNSTQAVTGDPASDPNFQLVTRDCGQMVGGTLDECDWGDFLALISRIMQYVIFISASIAVLSFVYAGFLYLTAFGEMGKVEQAHNIFSATITGLVIVMLAWLIVATILKVLEVSPEFTILQGIDNVQAPAK